MTTIPGLTCPCRACVDFRLERGYTAPLKDPTREKDGIIILYADKLLRKKGWSGPRTKPERAYQKAHGGIRFNTVPNAGFLAARARTTGEN